MTVTTALGAHTWTAIRPSWRRSTARGTCTGPMDTSVPSTHVKAGCSTTRGVDPVGPLLEVALGQCGRDARGRRAPVEVDGDGVGPGDGGIHPDPAVDRLELDAQRQAAAVVVDHPAVDDGVLDPAHGVDAHVRELGRDVLAGVVVDLVEVSEHRRDRRARVTVSASTVLPRESRKPESYSATPSPAPRDCTPRAVWATWSRPGSTSSTATSRARTLGTHEVSPSARAGVRETTSATIDRLTSPSRARRRHHSSTPSGYAGSPGSRPGARGVDGIRSGRHPGRDLRLLGRVAQQRPVGVITRGTTNPNRLRRCDRWLAGPQAWRLRGRPAPVVDLGYGASPSPPWSCTTGCSGSPRRPGRRRRDRPARVAAARPLERPA